MCWHKWTKWETYTRDMERHFFETNTVIPHIARFQKRTCIKCGLEQQKKIKDK